MSIQTIGLGTVANDGTGDSLRTAGGKLNAMFAELYAEDADLSRRISEITSGAFYSTRSQLYGDLDHDAGTIGWVYGDFSPEFRGIYTKSGSSGSGSWTKTLDLPWLAQTFDTVEATDGVTYSVVWADYNNNVWFGFDTTGRMLIPGNVTEERDPDLAYALVFNDDVIGLGLPTDGSKAKIRGWEPSASWPDVSHIILAGQSNAFGGDALPVVSSADIDGSLMFQRGQNTWKSTENPTTPENRVSDDFRFVTLRQERRDSDGVTGERFSSGISPQLKTAMAGSSRFCASNLANTFPHLLFSCPHRGSRYLSELSYLNEGSTGHFATYLDDITRAKAEAAKYGWTYGIAAMIWSQGENEGGNLKMTPSGSTLTWAQIRTQYADALKDAFDEWDTQGRAITGQGRSFPMFILQMAQSRAVATAQYDAASTHPSIFLVGPQFYVPSAINSEYDSSGTLIHASAVHMSADGQRWLGEQCAKVMRRVMIEGRDWTPLYPSLIKRVSDTLVVIKFNVPHAPLEWEDYHLPEAVNKGFRIYAGTPTTPGSECTITSVEITATDEVSIRVSPTTPVTAGGSFHVDYISTSSAGATGANVATVRTGSAFANGQASTELKLNVSLSSLTTRYLREGAFQVKVYSSGTPSIWVRAAYEEGGVTVLKGETREVTGTFVSGASAVEFLRDRPWGNLRDSDPALSIHKFTDTGYGTRQGQHYPLYNFACSFAEMITT